MNAELEIMRKSYQEKLQSEFKNITKAFFEEVPVQAVAWTQYTPYFNDGDDCVFSVNEPIFILEGFEPEDVLDVYEYEDDDLYVKAELWGSWTKEYYEKHNPEKYAEYLATQEKYPGVTEKCEAFKTVIQKNPEILEQVFGNHVQVILTKDENYVNEYDHD